MSDTPRTDAVADEPPGDFNIISIYTLARQLERELREVEAGAAVMRSAIIEFMSSCTDDSSNYVGGVERLKLESALSTNTGREMLEEHQEAVAHREFLRGELDKAKAEVSRLAFHLSPEKEKELRAELTALRRKVAAAERIAGALQNVLRCAKKPRMDNSNARTLWDSAVEELAAWQEANK